jgi:hypothetical protein
MPSFDRYLGGNMNLRFRRLTTILLAFLSSFLMMMFSHLAFAHESSPKTENRVGQMSEAVIQSRLKQLGYSKPTMMKLRNNNLRKIQVDGRVIPTTQYEVNAIENGTSVLLRVDRLSGKIEKIPANNR